MPRLHIDPSEASRKKESALSDLVLIAFCFALLSLSLLIRIHQISLREISNCHIFTPYEGPEALLAFEYPHSLGSAVIQAGRFVQSNPHL